MNCIVLIFVGFMDPKIQQIEPKLHDLGGNIFLMN